MENKKLEKGANVVERFIKKLDESGAFSMEDETKEELLKSALENLEEKIKLAETNFNLAKNEFENYKTRYNTVKEAYEHCKDKKEKDKNKEVYFLGLVKEETLDNPSAFNISQRAKIAQNPEDYVVISKSEFKDILDEIKKSENFVELCTTERKNGIDIICLKGRSEYVHRNVDVFDGKYVIPLIKVLCKVHKGNNKISLDINNKI